MFTCRSDFDYHGSITGGGQHWDRIVERASNVNIARVVVRSIFSIKYSNRSHPLKIFYGKRF